jgi:hypothetical protein
VLRFTHQELFLVRVLTSCNPVVGVMSFFLLELQQFCSESSMLEMLPFAGFLLWYRLPLFSPQQGSWSSHSLVEVQGLSCSLEGECCALGDAGLLISAE